MPARRLDFINHALDDLKERMQLQSDAALAEHLGVSRQMLGQVRSGETRVPPAMLARVIDKAGYALTRDAILSLLPRDSASTIRSFDNKRAARRNLVIKDPRTSVLFDAIDTALDHFERDELLDAIEYYVQKRK